MPELEYPEVEEFLAACVMAAKKYLAMPDKRLARELLIDAHVEMCIWRDLMDEEIRIQRNWSLPRHKRGGIRLET